MGKIRKQRGQPGPGLGDPQVQVYAPPRTQRQGGRDPRRDPQVQVFPGTGEQLLADPGAGQPNDPAADGATAGPATTPVKGARKRATKRTGRRPAGG